MFRRILIRVIGGIGMLLSKRLMAVAAMTAPYARVADIGSDHAYLPVFLVAAGRVTVAIAGEVKEGPLSAARQNIQSAGMIDRIAARLGDGLQVIKPGEVDVAVVAGMGGQASIDILAKSPEVTTSLKRIVCQPMNGSARLRDWLARHGWKLAAEDLVLEDGRLYEIIAAEPGEMLLIDPLMLEIGPLLWQQRHPLLDKHLENLLKKLELQEQAMAESARPSVSARRTLCQEKIRKLEDLMRCL